jgi:hypothetical protein
VAWAAPPGHVPTAGPTGQTAQAGHPDKRACLAANEAAQKLRKEDKLRSAREQLLVCARAQCPVVVRQDCAQWLNEVMVATPSVVVAARDASGKETIAVKVTIDGEAVLQTLDGKSLTIDPGVHHFKYENEEGIVHEEDVAIREGEKNRVLYVSFQKAPPAEPEPAPAAEQAPTAAPKRGNTVVTTRSPVPVGAYVFGGLGVVAVGLGAYFVIGASSDASNLRSTCAPNCSHADVNSARHKALLGDILIGVGAASILAAVWMALVRPITERAETTSASLDVGPTRGGAIVRARGAF